jgi:hypothetical protein
MTILKKEKSSGRLSVRSLILRQDLKMDQYTRPTSDEILTLISEISDKQIVYGQQMASLVGLRSEKQSSPTPLEIDYAHLILSLFSQRQTDMRDYVHNPNFGKETKVIGNVTISPFDGVKKLIQFQTTHHHGVPHCVRCNSMYLFNTDLKQESINTFSAGFDLNLITGIKNGKLEVIGKTKELLGEHGKNLLSNLQKNYQRIGEISVLKIEP